MISISLITPAGESEGGGGEVAASSQQFLQDAESTDSKREANIYLFKQRLDLIAKGYFKKCSEIS